MIALHNLGFFEVRPEGESPATATPPSAPKVELAPATLAAPPPPPTCSNGAGARASTASAMMSRALLTARGGESGVCALQLLPLRARDGDPLVVDGVAALGRDDAASA